jgi:hypothetical protein
MTVILNNDNGLQARTTEHQAVTGGIFYCRDSADFSVSASNKLWCNFIGLCFDPPRRTATKHTANPLGFMQKKSLQTLIVVP